MSALNATKARGRNDEGQEQELYTSMNLHVTLEQLIVAHMFRIRSASPLVSNSWLVRSLFIDGKLRSLAAVAPAHRRPVSFVPAFVRWKCFVPLWNANW